MRPNKLNIIFYIQKKIYSLLVILLLLLLGIYVLNNNRETASIQEIQELNQTITREMDLCQQTQALACYKELAYTLAKNFNMKDILSVFEQNENTPAFFGKCHTTLHFLGQEEYRITKNIAKSLSAGTPICFAGFYHGALEAYLTESGLVDDNKKLAEVIPDLCGTEKSFIVKKIYNECLHGLGHALMFATNDELPESLKLCDTLESGSDRNWCYSGVFMENSTSSTNKDHPSKYLKKDDPLYPCNTLESKYGDMCYMLQSFYFAEIKNYDWKEVEKLCKQVPLEFQDQCFNAIGQTQVGATQDLSVMRDNCYLLSSKEHRTNCLGGIVGALGERYGDGWSRVLSFCNNTLSSEEDKNNCYNLAIELSGTWISDQKTQETFCNQINSVTQKTKCLEETKYVSKSIEKTADEIIDACRNQDSDRCYRTKLGGVSNSSGLIFTRDVLREIQTKDSRTYVCHSIAHTIGSKAIQKDPDSWEEMLIAITPNECAYGFFHGILEGHIAFDPDFTVNADQIKNICGTDDRKLSLGACVHIFGHLMVFNSGGKIENGITECSKLPVNMMDQCYSGVFMEFTTKMVQKDHIGSISGDNQQQLMDMPTVDMEKLCSNYTGIAYVNCWGELGWRYASINSTNHTETILSGCQKAKEPNAVSKCQINAAISIATSDTSNQDEVNNICKILNHSPETHEYCIARIIDAMIQNSFKFSGRATGVCESSDSKNKESCFMVLDNTLKLYMEGN